jgi:hypothetical protein
VTKPLPLFCLPPETFSSVFFSGYVVISALSAAVVIECSRYVIVSALSAAIVIECSRYVIVSVLSATIVIECSRYVIVSVLSAAIVIKRSRYVIVSMLSAAIPCTCNSIVTMPVSTFKCSSHIIIATTAASIICPKYNDFVCIYDNRIYIYPSSSFRHSIPSFIGLLYPMYI